MKNTGKINSKRHKLEVSCLDTTDKKGGNAWHIYTVCQLWNSKQPTYVKQFGSTVDLKVPFKMLLILEIIFFSLKMRRI